MTENWTPIRETGLLLFADCAVMFAKQKCSEMLLMQSDFAMPGTKQS